MNYTDPFVLGEDVLLIPCADLGDDLRRRITFDEGDFTLSRRHGRALAQVIDRDTAALLELFREPRTIVDAVFENSRSLGRDPEVWFDQLLPHLGTFVDNGVLVPAGSEEEKEIRPQFEDGATFAGYTIVHCASLVEDREIYQMRGAALKIARRNTPELRRLFRNEAAILRHLEGSGLAPRLLKTGVREGRPYLIIEWLSGVDGGAAANHRRHDRASLIDLCASIAATYAALHERGVLHGDVHWQNMLVDDGRVRLLDFGYARFTDRRPRIGRAAMPLFFEPEYLAAERKGRSLPASAAGEQYAVAALLYLLITGQPYLDLRFERDEMNRQIETEPPLPFAARSLMPWPEVERILFRALEKDPRRRHASMSEIAARLADVRDTLTTPLSAEAHAFLDRTLQALAPGGETYVTRDRVDCADVAIGLLRIAEVRGDARLLALAAVWQSRAAATHPHAAKTHAAAAMIAAARGDVYSEQVATAAFVEVADADVSTSTAPRDTVADAYALLDLYRQTGDSACLGRARELAEQAVGAGPATSHRVAALIADLESPENARMPFFE